LTADLTDAIRYESRSQRAALGAIQFAAQTLSASSFHFHLCLQKRRR
jgi:hypothetical protein